MCFVASKPFSDVSTPTAFLAAQQSIVSNCRNDFDKDNSPKQTLARAGQEESRLWCAEGDQFCESAPAVPSESNAGLRVATQHHSCTTRPARERRGEHETRRRKLIFQTKQRIEKCWLGPTPKNITMSAECEKNGMPQEAERKTERKQKKKKKKTNSTVFWKLAPSSMSGIYSVLLLLRIASS
jgi:hypothetical protein